MAKGSACRCHFCQLSPLPFLPTLARPDVWATSLHQPGHVLTSCNDKARTLRGSKGKARALRGSKGLAQQPYALRLATVMRATSRPKAVGYACDALSALGLPEYLRPILTVNRPKHPGGRLRRSAA